jgi:hypothetical protein
MISVAAMTGLLEAISEIPKDSLPVPFSLSFSKRQAGKRAMIASDYTSVKGSTLRTSVPLPTLLLTRQRFWPALKTGRVI